MLRTRSLLVALLTLTAACSWRGCLDALDPSKVVKRDAVPVVARDFPLGAEFRFALDEYNWEIGGSELISVDERGDLSHVFYRLEQRADAVWVPAFMRRRFRVSPEQLSALRELLHEEKFVELGASYTDEAIHDGEHTTFTLHAGGREKRVECANWYPEPIASVRAFMRRLADQPPKASSVQVLTHEEAVELGALK